MAFEDGGMGSGPAIRATVIAPAPELRDDLVAASVGTATAVGPSGSTTMPSGFSDAIDRAIDGVFPLPGPGLATFTVRSNDPMPEASGAVAIAGPPDVAVDATAAPAGIAGIATTPGANALQVEASTTTSLAGFPSPVVAAARLSGSGSTFTATEQGGGPSFADGPPGVLVAVPTVAGPLLPLPVAALFTTGMNGQANIAFSIASGGNGLQLNQAGTITVEAGGPLFYQWTAPTDAPIQVSLPAPTVAASGSFLMAPLIAKGGDVSLKIAASGAGALALGVAASSANAGPTAEIGSANLVAFGPSNAVVNACRALAGDPAPALGGRGLAAMAISRDAHDWRNPAVVEIATANPRRVRDPDVLPASVELAPQPQSSGLIVDLTPFDRLAVGQTIDQFLERLDLLGAGLSSIQQPMDVAAELLAVAVAVTVWLVGPRILRRPRPDSRLVAYDDATSLDGISGLDGSTSPEES
jgi:hypothetical protein